jgi:MFS family permease
MSTTATPLADTDVRDRRLFLLLNIGHLLDHLFTLIFATVAALVLAKEWGMGYADLLKFATPGFLAFGLFSLPAGWVADKWNRDGMMVVFFVGVGLAAIATGLATTPLQIGIGLFVVGVFAAIYHPVGLAIVTEKWKDTGMRLAINGVWGNFGVAAAALVTGALIDLAGWRAAFIVPGLVSIGFGLAYARLRWAEVMAPRVVRPKPAPGAARGPVLSPEMMSLLKRISIIVFVTTAVSSLIFQSTGFALPKIFEERLPGLAQDLLAGLKWLGLAGRADTATMIGLFAFVVFAIASFAQLLVGRLLDIYGPRWVFVGAAAMQLVFFALMPGATEGWALAFALGFMLGAFGQIPITDFMIGKMATGEFRARVYGARYVVSFTVLGLSLPFISFVYAGWGFDTLFQILTLSALVILVAVWLLPSRLPRFETASVAKA